MEVNPKISESVIVNIKFNVHVIQLTIAVYTQYLYLLLLYTQYYKYNIHR